MQQAITTRRDTPMATVEGTDSATVQRMFAQAIRRWRASGVRVAGLIEERHGLADRTCSAGSLRDIVTGRSYSIYLEILPPNAICHIDAKGAEEAGAAVLDEIATSDLVVLSKFGKLEAGHRGLIGAFEAAIGARKPILTTVAEKHREAWHTFAPGATVLPPSTAAIESWWASVRSVSASAGQA